MRVCHESPDSGELQDKSRIFKSHAILFRGLGAGTRGGEKACEGDHSAPRPQSSENGTYKTAKTRLAGRGINVKILALTFK